METPPRAVRIREGSREPPILPNPKMSGDRPGQSLEARRAQAHVPAQKLLSAKDSGKACCLTQIVYTVAK